MQQTLLVIFQGENLTIQGENILQSQEKDPQKVAWLLKTRFQNYVLLMS